MKKEEKAQEALFYLIRPDDTAIWLPKWLMEALGVERRDKLTESQINDHRVQELLAARIEAQKKKGKTDTE